MTVEDRLNGSSNGWSNCWSVSEKTVNYCLQIEIEDAKLKTQNHLAQMHSTSVVCQGPMVKWLRMSDARIDPESSLWVAWNFPAGSSMEPMNSQRVALNRLERNLETALKVAGKLLENCLWIAWKFSLETASSSVPLEIDSCSWICLNY